MALSKKDLDKYIAASKQLAPILKMPKNEQDYNELVAVLEDLLDIVNENENHALAPIAHAIGSFISEYEEAHQYDLQSTPVERLRYLMEEHHLTQDDLAPEFGSQSIVSEVLNGKRELNKRHIQALSKRFNVSPSVFFE